MTDRKTCPFCGSKAQLDTKQVESGWWAAYVMCEGMAYAECTVQMVSTGKTEEDAVRSVTRMWNRREDA